MIEQSPYEVLNISDDFSLESVKSKYVELVRKFPPEKNPEEFMKIRKAYEYFTKVNSSQIFLYHKPLEFLPQSSISNDLPNDLLQKNFEVPFSVEADLATLLTPVEFSL